MNRRYFLKAIAAAMVATAIPTTARAIVAPSGLGHQAEADLALLRRWARRWLNRDVTYTMQPATVEMTTPNRQARAIWTGRDVETILAGLAACVREGRWRL